MTQTEEAQRLTLTHSCGHSSTPTLSPGVLEEAENDPEYLPRLVSDSLNTPCFNCCRHRCVKVNPQEGDPACDGRCDKVAL